MKKTLIASAVVAMLGFATTASAMPTYNPVGPQLNVGIGTVTGGGWRLCHSEAFGAYGTSIASVATACDGDLMMLAGGLNDSQTLSLLAWAPEVDVMFATGTGNTTHAANGSEWYYDPSWSWGFAPAGALVSRNSCDINDSTSFTSGGPTVNQRLCFHTDGGTLSGGWRVGAADFLNGEPSGYTRYFFTADSNDVPEPASLALLGAGLFGLGVSRRRKAAR